MLCDRCSGTGRVMGSYEREVRNPNTWCGSLRCQVVREAIEVDCGVCGGTGHVHYVNVEHWCSGCNGTGQRNERREIIQTYPTGRQISTGQYTTEVVTCSHCSGSGRETRSDPRAGKGQEDNKKEGCFITTAVCNEFDSLDADIILNKFRSFRDNWLSSKQNGSALISQYYNEAPQILEKIDLAKYRETMKYIWDTYLSRCLSMIENDENDQALEIYQEMFHYLKKDTGV